MLRISEMVGFPVYCNDTQKKEGRIKDFLINIEENKIKWLLINCGNILHKTKFINYNTIYSIGKDLVIIKSKSNLLKDNMVSKDFSESTKVFFGKKVISEKGDIIGFIDDIIFEEAEGKILGLILTNGIIDDILFGVNILPVDDSFRYTSDKLIISENYRKNIINNIGGLKKFLELEE